MTPVPLVRARGWSIRDRNFGTRINLIQGTYVYDVWNHTNFYDVLNYFFEEEIIYNYFWVWSLRSNNSEILLLEFFPKVTPRGKITLGVMEFWVLNKIVHLIRSTSNCLILEDRLGEEFVQFLVPEWLLAPKKLYGGLKIIIIRQRKKELIDNSQFWYTTYFLFIYKSPGEVDEILEKNSWNKM